MSIRPIDFANTALSRIAQQYRDKEKYVQLVQGLCELTQTYIDDPLEYLLTLYDIDISEGRMLDVIGDIVGQPRVLIDFNILSFFGYDGAVNAGTYGSVSDPNLGARYLSKIESGLSGETTLSDPEYRIFIKGRILRNYSASTPEDIIESIITIFNLNRVGISEGVMSISIDFIDGTINETDLNIIQNYDIIPRPTGVSIDTSAMQTLSSPYFSGSLAFFGEDIHFES